ncbi:hypothetical protein Tco_1051802, partial [Tanacetum coccineum]
AQEPTQEKGSGYGYQWFFPSSKETKGDYGTSSGAATEGKSPSVLKELLASSILNVEVGVKAVTTLLLVTSSVSTTSGREGGNPTDSITGLNLRTIGASEGFVISSDSSHHYSTHASGDEVDSIIRSAVLPPVMTEAVVTSHAANDPPIRFGEEFNVGTARQAFLNKEARDDDVENLKAQLLLKETEAAEAARLRAQRNVALENEKDSLDGKVTELQSLVFAKDLELKDLNVVVSSLKSQNNGLVDQVAKLDADLLEMALHLEEKFYPHLLNTISGRRWLLTRGVKLAVVKCLNSQEYLMALGSAISRAIEKGMQDRLSAGIDYEKAVRGLEDVVTYNPAAKANYNSAMQRLRELDFLLLSELSAHKDVSTVDIMNLLRLESPLTDAPGMSDLQPDCERHLRRSCGAAVALIDVWVPLVDLLSTQNLIGAASTSGSVQAAIVSTNTLSTTFASASSVPPITTDDYKIINVDGQEDS